MEVVAIGPQSPEDAKKMGLPFPVLSDPDLKTTTDYGLVHVKGAFNKDVPRPATVLVGKGSRDILWVKTYDNVRYRPPVEEIVEALRR